MMTQTQFDSDPSLTAKALTIIEPAANDAFILDNDPGYSAWLDARAMEFEIEHGDFYV